jgi:hypothetical protein
VPVFAQGLSFCGFIAMPEVRSFAQCLRLIQPTAACAGNTVNSRAAAVSNGYIVQCMQLRKALVPNAASFNPHPLEKT